MHRRLIGRPQNPKTLPLQPKPGTPLRPRPATDRPTATTMLGCPQAEQAPPQKTNKYQACRRGGVGGRAWGA